MRKDTTVLLDLTKALERAVKKRESGNDATIQ